MRPRPAETGWHAGRLATDRYRGERGGLHPLLRRPRADGSDGVKKILGSITGVAISVAELRNRGYGTGHGASLAVNAAITWCQLMLDTLADTNAPGAHLEGQRLTRAGLEAYSHNVVVRVSGRAGLLPGSSARSWWSSARQLRVETLSCRCADALCAQM